SEARIQSALQHFGLEDLGEFPAAYLSAGQKRRLGLSRLLVADRPLWLLDEPTASLDTASSDRLVAAVNAHTSAGGLAVIATHLPLALERARTLDLVAQRMAA
ncbi:MAG TPA: ATP-binding cassette domain-containing protein, partial [Hyphomicrobium sp.]|nr:ATP-binding cassette domain-containing protein [Hyphomicrobium sp.]